MNPYTSLWTGVTEGDGPREFHLVLVDNGRTNVLADEIGRQALNCIRCSACLNVCPVYERTGGHAYGSTYPGPIGAILTPMLSGLTAAGSLPYASSLCGACYEVCPVKINIPEVLVHLRHEVVARSARAPGVRERVAPEHARHAGHGPRLRQPPAVRGGPAGGAAVAVAARPRREDPAPARAALGLDLGARPARRAARRAFATGGGSGRERRPRGDPAPHPRARWTTCRRRRRAADVAVARDYRRAGELGRSPRWSTCWPSGCADYAAEVRRVAAAAAGRRRHARRVADWGCGRVVVPPGLPEAWRPRGVELLEDEGLSAAELDAVDGAVTGCAAAIAETGTLVLDGSPICGRRVLTLVPDHHICIVLRRADRASIVPEAIAAVAPAVRERRRPITLVSGPSASSDIELRRVEGVHGPRHLLVLIAT